MIKNIKSKLYKFYPLWIFFIAVSYFFAGQPFFESFNPSVGFIHIIFYFNLIVFGGCLFILFGNFFVKKINKIS